jgi:hypothetical protein
VDAISLGEAFIDIKANTTGFKRDLATQLRATLESSRTATRLQMDDFDRLVASATAAGKRIIRAEAEAYKEAAAASKAATKAQEDDIDRLVASVAAGAKRIAAAESEAYKIAAAEAKAATDVQGAEFDRWVASATAAAQRVAAAESEAYAIVAADAKATADAQIASNREALAAMIASAAEMAAAETEAYAAVAAAATSAAAAQKASLAAQKASLTGLASASIIGNLKDIPGDVFGAITKSAKYATIGVLGLGAALAGIGLVSAAKQQAAVVGFTALAAQISATTDATTGLNTATVGLSQAQAGVIGQDFENRLIQLSNNSALAQTAIQDTSEALLALGFNGTQSLSMIRDIGNALAASGKTGGGLNDDLKGIVTALSQVSGAGRLLAQDLNQITTRIPSAGRIQVYTELGKALHLAGASAKQGTPQFAAFLIQIQKLAKAGQISSQVAIPAIIKALQQVPGAAVDAATGLDALGRQNLTLTGRFEALKDNVRSALAKAFLLPGQTGGPPGKSLSDNLATEIGAAIPAITTAIKNIGPSLGNFVSGLATGLAKLVPPLFSLISKTFDGLSRAASAINLNGIIHSFDQLTTKGTDANRALSAVGTVMKEMYQIGVSLTPVVAGIAKGFAALTIALAGLEPVVKVVAAALKAITGSGAGQTLIALGTIFFATRVAVSLLGTALIGTAGWATKAAISMASFGTAAAVAGSEAAAAGTGIAAANAAAVGSGIAGTAAAGGLAAGGFAATGLGRALTSTAAKATIIIPLLVTAGFVGYNMGQKVHEGARNAAEALDEANRAANALVPAYRILDQHTGDLGVSTAYLSDNLNAMGIQALADSFTTGTFTDTISGLINAMESSGDSAATVVQKLEDMGIGSQNAQDAVKGLGTGIAAANADLDALSTDAARGELRALQLQALMTAGAIRGLASSGGNPFVSSTQGELPGSLPIENPAASAASAAVSAAVDAAANPVSLPGGGGGGGGGGGAKKAAKTAANNIKATFLQALKDILASLDSDFKKTLTGGTRKQIDTALDTLSKKIASVFKAGKQKRPSALLDDIAADNVKLKNKADERDKILDKLKKATDRFNEVKSSIQAFASVSSIDLDAIGLSATKATEKLVDLSRLRIILPGQDTLSVLTGGGVANLKAGSAKFAQALADKLKAIQDFQTNVKKLIAEGLNKTTIDQIISAGPEGGGVLAASLAGASPATVASINTSQKAIDAAATTLGNTAADSLFRAGTSVVDGLIAGLKSKRDEIKAAMKGIADSLVAEIRKALKSHSPSMVMHEVGRDIGAGLHIGMASKAADITAAARDMAQAAVPPNLVRMGHADAASRLSALGLPTMSSRGTSTSTATNSKTYHAPITQHFHQSGHDPNVVAKALAKAVGGLR